MIIAIKKLKREAQDKIFKNVSLWARVYACEMEKVADQIKE